MPNKELSAKLKASLKEKQLGRKSFHAKVYRMEKIEKKMEKTKDKDSKKAMEDELADIEKSIEREAGREIVYET